MKRVLVLAWAYPPSVAAGARRPAKLASHLPAFGWEPLVLTTDRTKRDRDAKPRVFTARDWTRRRGGALGRHDPAPAGGRVRQWCKATLRDLLFVPDTQRGWWPAAIREARRIHAEFPVHAILATSPPFSSLLLGRRLKRQFEVPLVAEFRDPWSHSFDDLRKSERARRLRRERRMEAQVMESADGIVVTAPHLQSEILRDYPALDPTRVASIPNGCDADDYRGLEPWPFNTFAILYTGTLERQQAPEPFFDALAAVSDPADRGRWELHLVGSIDDVARRRIADLGLSERTVIHGPKDHRTVRRMQLGADLLAVCLSGADSGRRISGKIFEYLCVDAPMLAVIPPEGATANVLTHVGRGTVVNPADPAAIERELALHLAAGRAPHRPRAEIPSAYDRREQARAVARLLDTISH